MAKKSSVSITGFNKTSEKIITFFNNAVKDEEILRTEAKFIKEQIKARTISGVDKEYKQPPLTKGTIKRRDALMKAGNRSTYDKVKPSSSSLTLSGQLLDSIIYEIKASLQFIHFTLKPSRRPYLGVRGKALENKTNTEIKKDLEEKGRRFFFLSENLKIQIENRFQKSIKAKYKEWIKSLR